MRKIVLKGDKALYLARSGENGAAKICVDVTAWLHEFPSGSGALLYKRPDGQIYPLTTALDGGQLYAVLTSVDTAISGVCRVEAQWLDGDVIVKSRVYEGSVAPSLGAAGSVPEASPSWVDDMAALGVTVAADKVQVAADKEIVAADKAAANGSADDARAAQAGAEGAYATAVIARDAAQAAKTDAQTAQAAAAQSATEASGSATAAQQTATQIVTDEAARATAEQSRVSAEQGRVTAEQTRVSAEQGRVTAEEGRVTAEQGRVTAEQGRVEAEAQRGTALATHEARTDNPHSVTADQVGAVSYGGAQALTDAQKAVARGNIDVDKAAGVMTLIEKIIVGYSLTTAEPSDWATSWTAYYTNAGTAVEPVYTALTDASAPTWTDGTYYAYDAGGVSTIIRTQEPDGTSYNFTLVYVLISYPASAANGGMLLYYYDRSTLLYATYPYNSQTGSTCKAVSCAYSCSGRYDGFWTNLITGTTNITNVLMGPYFSIAQGSDKKITKVTFNRSAKIASGSEFQIYGVRA